MTKSEVFQLGKSAGKGRKVVTNKPHLIKTLQVNRDFPEVKPVQGKMPDSKEEYWVALALYKLRLDFDFQRQVMGGRALRGGQVVDFWVFTVPKPTPLLVQGEYWHYTATRRMNSMFAVAALEDYYRGQINEVVEVLDSEMPTPDMAFQVVRRKLRM